MDEVDPELTAAAAYCLQTVHAYARWMQGSAEVQPGSLIEQDDRVFRVMAMQQLIAGPIKASMDCLLLACWSLDQSPHVRGHGHPALIRSALGSAATALWAMDDDTDERRLRGLQMALDQANAELEFVEQQPSAFRANASPDFNPTEFIKSRRQRCNDVIANGESLGFDATQVKKKPKDNQIVYRGGNRVPTERLWNTGSSGDYVRSEWRVLSGRAHGYGWPIPYGSPPQPNSDDPRFVTHDIAWSLDRTLGSIRTTLRVVYTSLERWAGMSGNPPPALQMP